MPIQTGREKNILLFACRRGGSSILSELLSSDPRIREIDQPFDQFQSPENDNGTRREYLPVKILSQYFKFNKEGEKEKFNKYVQGLVTGKFKALSKPSLTKKNRTVLKIVNAGFLLDYIKEEFGGTVLYMSRHPIPQALSVIRNKWGFTTEAFLRDKEFLLKYINEDQYEFAVKVEEEGSDLERGVLNWVFENLYPLKFAKEIDLGISYEDLVLREDEVIEQIEEKLDLKVDRKLLNKPSRSSPLSNEKTIKAIEKEDKSFLVTKWEKKVNKEDRKKIQTILDKFEIEKYSAWETRALK